jgi:hypothetical protein
MDPEMPTTEFQMRFLVCLIVFCAVPMTSGGPLSSVTTSVC